MAELASGVRGVDLHGKLSQYAWVVKEMVDEGLESGSYGVRAGSDGGGCILHQVFLFETRDLSLAKCETPLLKHVVAGLGVSTSGIGGSLRSVHDVLLWFEAKPF